jgi:hypothetical protein
MGLETIGLGLTIASGVMGIAQGFAQAGTVKAQAAAQEVSAKNTYYSQQAAVTQQENEQAQQETAQVSTRIAAANRNLGTLQAVMGERGMAGATFTGLLNDLSNSESLDLTRVGTNFDNAMSSDRSKLQAAGQDYENVRANSEMTRSSANTSAWLNAIGTVVKVGGSYAGQQMKLNAYSSFENQRLNARTSGYYEPSYGE